MDDPKTPELPKELVDKAVEFADKRIVVPLVPGFIKRAYIRKFIEGSWSKILKEDGGMLEKIRLLVAGRKTYLVALGAIIGTVVAWSNGQLDAGQAVQHIVEAILAMTIRAGVSKSGPIPAPAGMTDRPLFVETPTEAVSLPCPWCGSEVFTLTTHKDGGYYAHCRNRDCYALGPTAKTPNEAVERWNSVVRRVVN